MIAAKHFDMVVGVDIHINLIPGTPPVPTPLPHIYAGMILDPFDYLPYFGQTLIINYRLAAQPMTECKFTPQFPIAGPFTKPPEMKGEVVTGSMTVGTVAMTLSQMGDMAKALGGAVVDWLSDAPPPPPPPPAPPPPPPTIVNPLSRLGDIALGCADVGPPAPDNKDKKGGVKGLTFVAGVVIAIPTGFPVLVSGAPMIAPPSAFVMKYAMKFGMKALGKVLKGAGKLLNKYVIKGLAKKSNFFDNVSAKMCKWFGEPIDAATGKMLTSREDFSIPGPIPLVWTCNYKTCSQYNGPAGYGWHHSYDISLTACIKDGFPLLELRMSDGRIAYFPRLQVGESWYDQQEKINLSRDEKGYLIRNIDQLYYRFHENNSTTWPLAEITNCKGMNITFDYDEFGALTKIIDTTQRIFKINTDINGRILAINAPHPNIDNKTFPIVRYEYNEKGHLIAAFNALNQPFLYSYNEFGLMTKLTYRNGLNFYYQYDRNDYQARCIHSHGDGGLYYVNATYEVGKTVLERIVGHPDGHKETYIETYYHDGAVVLKEIDAMGNEKSYEYNEDYDLLAEEDSLGRRTDYRYDKIGNLIEVKYPDSSSVAWNYEGNNLVNSTDQMGGNWNWEYNDKGLVTLFRDCMDNLKKYEYNENGLIIAVTNSEGNVTRLNYDKYHNIVQMTTANNTTYRWYYDRLGRCQKRIDPKGNTYERKFDLLGNIIQVNKPDGSCQFLEYDAANNLVRVEGQNLDIEFEYMGLGSLVARKEKGGDIRLEYNSEEEIVGIINQNGYMYRFDLDCNGEIEIESDFDEIKRYYKRDKAGRIINILRASGNETQYVYDDMDRVVSVKHLDVSGKIEMEKYVYRKDGELIEAENFNSHIRLERNALGQIVKEWEGDHWIESTYNSLGQRTKMSSLLGAELQFNRNVMGEVQNVSAQLNSEIWEVGLQYDLLGLETGRTFSNGLGVNWRRDKLGRPLEQKVFSLDSIEKDPTTRNYTWDINDRLTSLQINQNVSNKYGYNSYGDLIWKRYGNGEKEFRVPDKVGNYFRKEDLSDRKYGSSGQLLEADGIKYFYDEDGYLHKKLEKNGGTWYYHWNTSGMLKTVIRPDGKTVSFTYDPMGRRLSKEFDGTITRWVWDANVPLHEWNEKVEESSGFSFESDSKIFEEENKPSNSKLSITQIIQLNEAKNSSTKIISGDNHTKLVTYLFDPGKFSPMAKFVDGKAFNIITDHLGTPLAMYDSTGNKTWAAETTTYGELKWQEGQKESCPFRFPGQFEDIETGLYYNRWRYYDPKMGVYINADPIRTNGGIKLYSYVEDINTRFDPLGLDSTALGRALENAGQTRVSGQQGHHLIPEEVWGENQRMFDRLGMEMDAAENGVLLSDTESGRRAGRGRTGGARDAVYHRGSHPNYSESVRRSVSKIRRQYNSGAISASTARQRLRRLQTRLRSQLKNGVPDEWLSQNKLKTGCKKLG